MCLEPVWPFGYPRAARENHPRAGLTPMSPVEVSTPEPVRATHFRVPRSRTLFHERTPSFVVESLWGSRRKAAGISEPSSGILSQAPEDPNRVGVRRTGVSWKPSSADLGSASFHLSRPGAFGETGESRAEAPEDLNRGGEKVVEKNPRVLEALGRRLAAS